MEEQIVSSQALVPGWKFFNLPIGSGNANRCFCGNLPGSYACQQAHQKKKSNPAKLLN